jgi:anti-anti-sigma regulatory factor
LTERRDRWLADHIHQPSMTLRIERYSDPGTTTIRLIGRMQAEHVSEVERQIEDSGTRVTLDLEEVTLVDVQVVRSLPRASRDL